MLLVQARLYQLLRVVHHVYQEISLHSDHLKSLRVVVMVHQPEVLDVLANFTLSILLDPLVVFLEANHGGDAAVNYLQAPGSRPMLRLFVKLVIDLVLARVINGDDFATLGFGAVLGEYVVLVRRDV